MDESFSETLENRKPRTDQFGEMANKGYA